MESFEKEGKEETGKNVQQLYFRHSNGEIGENLPLLKIYRYTVFKLI